MNETLYSGPSAKPHDSGVAVSIIVKKNDKILLLKRQGGATGVGTWSMPGGGVEFMEDPIEAAKRELFEETGLRSSNFTLIGYSNDTHPKERLHYVTFTFVTGDFEGEPYIAEPHKCSEIGWFSPHDLPSPLYEPFMKKLATKPVKNLLGL